MARLEKRDFHYPSSKERSNGITGEGRLNSALDWYLGRSLAAAEAFVMEIAYGIQLIQETPQMWPAFEGNTRRYVLRKFPYSIIFRQVDDCIEVVAVAHHKRRPGYWSNR